MTFFVVLFLVLALLFLPTFFLVKYTRGIKLVDRKVIEALPDFFIDENSVVITLRSQVSVILNRHQNLYEEVCLVKDIKLPWRKTSPIPEFKETFQKYEERIGFQNRRVETRLFIEENLPKALGDITKYSNNRFFAYSEWEHLTRKYHDLLCALDLRFKLNIEKYFNGEHCYRVIEVLGSETFRKNHNSLFIPEELKNKNEYFKNLLEYPLDIQQRDAIVKSEDNCLVIASAGSGKTSTIIGKARYLMDHCGVLPSEILLITFTNKAAAELRNRIGAEDVECKTFHKLALDIVGEYHRAKPSICERDNAYSIIFSELVKDDSFKCSLLDYFTIGQLILSHDFDTSQSYAREIKKKENVALLPDMDNRKIYTKSIEEKTLCFLLSSLGVKFRYEEAYQYYTRDRNYSQYRPDFSIYYKTETGEVKRIYLEHFAIDRNGQVPVFFGNESETWEEANRKYNEGIIWKRNLHRQNCTILIETHSYDFHEENILEVLKAELTRVGVPFTPVPPSLLYANVVKANNNIQELAFKMISSFINLMKSNCKNIDELIEEANQKNDKRNKMIMASLIKPFYEAYCQYLSDRKEVDFFDIISQATDICNSNVQFKKYKYILIDEFQDISYDRYKFVQSLRNIQLFTKLFCVGDDWQSIYRFAGSDMELFSKFSSFFGRTEECKIETTYRFSEPTIQISSQFIQKNPTQKSKNVRAFNTNKNTNLSFVSYNHESWSALPETVSDILDSIPEDKSVYILGRYNFDLDQLDKEDYRKQNDINYVKPLYVYKPNNRVPYVVTSDNLHRKYKFFSVHSAKGLEADYVILINCNSGIFGFPAIMEDDPVLIYVLSEQDHYTYAEERRLFYVAITRAKEHTYVVYKRDFPSDFVMEIDGNQDFGTPVCPRCNIGNLVLRRDTPTRYGSRRLWYTCSNSFCEYNKTEFVSSNT